MQRSPTLRDSGPSYEREAAAAAAADVAAAAAGQAKMRALVERVQQARAERQSLSVRGGSFASARGAGLKGGNPEWAVHVEGGLEMRARGERAGGGL